MEAKSKKNRKGRSKKPLNRRDSSKNERRDAEMRGTADREFRADQRDYERDHATGPNDVSWYAKNPQLVLDFASTSFNIPTGAPFTIGGSSAFVPGICAVYYDPQIGNATTENDPINIAMRNFYAYIRTGRSGRTNYDPPDMMMYLIAMDSAHMFLEYMKRVYGVATTTSIYNRYLGKYLVRAMGVDYDDLEEHVSDFRGFINIYASKLAGLGLPKDLSYVQRHSWMTSGVYFDSDNARGQMYIYVPRSFYQFNINSASSAGELVRAEWLAPGFRAQTSSLNSVASIIKFGNSLLNPMIVNQDFNIMSGDIIYKVGESGLQQPLGITENFVTRPVYSPEVLSQFENLTVVGAATNNVIQTTDVGTGFLKTSTSLFTGAPLAVSASATTDPGDFATTMSSILNTTNKLFNFHALSPTPAQIMVGSRLSVIPKGVTCGKSGNSITFSYALNDYGSETVASVVYYSFAYSSGNLTFSGYTVRDPVNVSWLSASNSTAEEAVAIGLNEALITRYSAFDWAPMLRLATVVFPNAGTSFSVYKQPLPVADLDAFVTVDITNLRYMHETALLSELSIPGMPTT